MKDNSSHFCRVTEYQTGHTVLLDPHKLYIFGNISMHSSPVEVVGVRHVEVASRAHKEKEGSLR